MNETLTIKSFNMLSKPHSAAEDDISLFLQLQKNLATTASIFLCGTSGHSGFDLSVTTRNADIYTKI